MAVKMTAVEVKAKFGSSSKGKYDWKTWADGSWWVLEKATDFPDLTNGGKVLPTARVWAGNNGFKLESRYSKSTPDQVAVCFTRLAEGTTVVAPEPADGTTDKPLTTAADANEVMDLLTNKPAADSVPTLVVADQVPATVSNRQRRREEKAARAVATK